METWRKLWNEACMGDHKGITIQSKYINGEDMKTWRHGDIEKKIKEKKIMERGLYGSLQKRIQI